MANVDYIKRELLNARISAKLSLNLGSSYAAEIDITSWIKDINVSVNEGVVDTSGDTSGQLIDKVDLKLDNTRGDFDPTGRFFKGGFVNNSKIKISAQYSDYEIVDGTPTPILSDYNPYVFIGLIKTDASTWIQTVNADKPERTFTAGLLQAANILASEVVNPGYIPNTPQSMTQTVFNILNQQTIVHAIVVDIGNISLGFDIAGCVDNPEALFGQRVLDVINQIGLLSNSKWYVDESGNFIMEPIKNSGSSSWDISETDIANVDFEITYNPLQFNSVTWDDGVNEVLVKRMPYLDRQKYGYDCFDKTINVGYINDKANRKLIMQSFLEQNQHQHRQMIICVKSNPDLRFNQIVTVNIPSKYAMRGFTWSQSEWGDGSNWGLEVPGFRVSPTILWRVLHIDRRLNLAPDMKLTLIQAGIGPDAEL